MEQWSSGVHARIAKAIRAARGTRSAQWVADRTVEVGHPITRAQITNYENGRKASLDVADLIVLAAALNTSPVTLLYPGPYEGDVEVLPGAQVSEFYAAQWFSGSIWSSSITTSSTEWSDSTAELRVYRRIQELRLARLRVIDRHIREGRPAESKEAVAEALSLYDQQIETLRQQQGLADDA